MSRLKPRARASGCMLMQALIEALHAARAFARSIAVIGDGHADSASVRLHEKLGFRHSGRLEGSGYKHGRWLDTVFMQLSLNGGATPAARSGFAAGAEIRELK